MKIPKILNIFQANSDWPEPELLRNTLLEVSPLPISSIPDAYCDWIIDVAERMQCPPDFVAVAAMVTTAAVVGTGCGIRPKQHDDWLVVPNLWGGIVGRPGMLKTPAVSEVMQLMKQLETEAKKSHEAAMTNYLAELNFIKQIKKQSKLLC